MTPEEIENRIKSIFEQNYEMLKLEGGHALTADSLQAALNQVLYYYRKLRPIAESVSETEVKLTLPEQFTPEGRKFTIEGVVDIVEEGDDVWMYDIKTHDPDYIRANTQLYESQLNVYSYIYQNLRGNKLDHTAIISTALPSILRTAIASGDENVIATELSKWDPLIEIPFDQNNVQATINDFALVVDKIETNCFEPPPAEVLSTKIEGTNVLFATRVCRNCDARFSCEAFREYSLKVGTRTQTSFKKYFEDFGNNAEQEQMLIANMDVDKLNTQPEIPK
ncbi:PD-(D/E)XK nuclease family protein [Puia dinghuensis]|uniref:PD-(D/E)XK endonuclease-like domain-containing protein n=1 Tax=Puia dinghuensis TaxID=1792502 RepID=A0A8J2UIX5_9BACT|nr:PD-(D/E)XK nuclease family protein [Puia dinghuensis]GGB24906.1 hypothetical protein GCM10011511_56050 [Puia dinghuensis]